MIKYQWVEYQVLMNETIISSSQQVNLIFD
jgi:hypothetical protein